MSVPEICPKAQSSGRCGTKAGLTCSKDYECKYAPSKIPTSDREGVCCKIPRESMFLFFKNTYMYLHISPVITSNKHVNAVCKNKQSHSGYVNTLICFDLISSVESEARYKYTGLS